MAGNGRRVAGIVAIVLCVLAAVAGILNYMGHHPRRGIAAFVACAVLLILGIVLVALSSRKSPQTPSQ
jgi:heme A synthase